MQQIMILRKNDGRDQLKILQVDDNTIAKLTKVRGNLYKDDPLLTLVRDLPEHKKPKEPECVVSPEMQARAEASYSAYKESERKAATMTPEPPQPMTFEEQLKHDWKYSPAIRSEFVSFASYVAYQKAAKAGRARVCGR